MKAPLVRGLATSALLAACALGPDRVSCEGALTWRGCVLVTIPRGATLSAAVESLTMTGVLRHPGRFRILARLHGLRSSLKSGVYTFHLDEDASVVIEALKRGRGAEIQWTVPEGLTLAEVAELAQTQLGVPRDSLLAAAKDPELAHEIRLPGQATSVEGYLFPTTYLVPVDVGARRLVWVMTREFLTQWRPEWQARLDSLHLTRHDVVTLASIIEAEVRYDPDRPYVAAVYFNRLKRGMPLQADPTVVYAYGRRLKRVREKNLTVRSPYNTYRYSGLPPGPISQPGRASIVAALYPASVPFLYFVAQPDGKHIFSATYAEHLATIRAVKRMRNGSRAPLGSGR